MVSQQPTRSRFVVLALLCAMSFVLYLDRVCLGQAVSEIKRDLQLDDRHISFIAMAFTLAYGLFEVPVGRWGDRIGARRTLTRIVVMWSFFTALTGACWDFWSMLVVRFLFGFGEAGAFPNAARVTTNWFPPAERGRYRGLFLACSLLGGAVAPMLAAWLIGAVGWRWNFVLFGAVGVVWAATFYWWFRDTPAEHRATNDAERALIGPPSYGSASRHEPIPWAYILGSRNIRCLTLVIVCSAFLTYFFFTWYPDYLQTTRKVPRQQAGTLSSLVLAGSTVGTFLGGVLNDWVRSPGGRKWLCAGATTLAACLMLAGSQTETPEAMSVLFSLAVLNLASFQAIWWGFCAEVGGKHLGAIFGFMNGVGAVGAMGSQFFFGFFRDWCKESGYEGREMVDRAFFVYVGVLLLAALCWVSINHRVLHGEVRHEESS